MRYEMPQFVRGIFVFIRREGIDYQADPDTRRVTGEVPPMFGSILFTRQPEAQRCCSAKALHLFHYAKPWLPLYEEAHAQEIADAHVFFIHILNVRFSHINHNLFDNNYCTFTKHANGVRYNSNSVSQ
jgi:hypothetical protein